MFAIRATAIFLALLPAIVQAEWYLQWKRQLPERKPAWEFTQRMGRDTGYSPATAGGIVFVGGEHNGALLGLDGKTGEERFRFYTGAPIRWAPVATKDRVFVGSDDGWLYCLDHSGEVVWKKRGGPSGRQVLGHGRMMSAWPISLKPLLEGDTLYFAAGYWPVDGIYIHAVDAATGKSRWTNSVLEIRPTRQITMLDGKLMIDGDNSSAVLDAKTGEVLNEKRIKPKPAERPQVSGLKGNMTGWSQADGVLTVGTTWGVFGFAETKPEKVAEHSVSPVPQIPTDGKIDAVLKVAGKTEGYCLVVWPDRKSSLIEDLLIHTKFHVVVVDIHPEGVAALRAKLDRLGQWRSHRVSVLEDSPAKQNLPPYFADLIISDFDDDVAKKYYHCLRPYGGVHVAYAISGQPKIIARTDGPPAGAGDWAQEFHDAGNTLASPDKLVKAPLGLLWYGGEAADARFYFDGKIDHQSGHGLNPQPVPAQVIEGRMILQGPGLLAAVDIYTGRVLWESKLPSVYTYGGGGGGLGIHSKKHPKPWEHKPAFEFDISPIQRCRASGFNMASTHDGIYVCAGPHLMRFDPKTGRKMSEWLVPVPSSGRQVCWGGIRILDGKIIATAFRSQNLIDAQAGHDGNGGDWAGDRMPMNYLIVLDRQTGNVKWTRTAKWGFLNRSGIAAGGGKVFCVDLLTEKILNKWDEAGRKQPDVPPTLHALDLEAGKPAWSFPLDVYVQNIVYSKERDLVLVPCRNLKEWRQDKWVNLAVDARKGRTNKNFAGRMRALSAKDGSVEWEVNEAPYHTPQILLGDLIIDRWGHSYDLQSGKRATRVSPITGQAEPWSFRKSGCNHLVACESLVTWRTAYYDLASQSGVKTLRGMDAGCSPTLLPAGGILNISNFGTHHKRNRMTAMALVHRPQNNLWTAYATSKEKVAPSKEPVWLQHVGYDFGAPGDRFASNGTLWLQVSARNRGNISWQPKEVSWFGKGDTEDASTVASSGIVGAREITVPVTKDKTPNNAESVYTVRLIFAAAASEGPLSITLAGETVAEDLKLKSADIKDGAVVREFTGVKIKGPLNIGLTSGDGTTALSGVELIRE